MSLLEKLLRGVRSLRERKDRMKRRIDVFEKHFTVGEASLTWEKISAVKAYKIDLFRQPGQAGTLACVT